MLTLCQSIIAKSVAKTFLILHAVLCLSPFLKSQTLSSWVILEKLHTPPTKGVLENLTGEGGGGVVNVSRDSDGTGTLNLNLHPRSRVTFINVSIVLKNCYAFSNFIIPSNCSPLTTFILSLQEHPTTVFSKISVRRSKYCLEFSIN